MVRAKMVFVAIILFANMQVFGQEDANKPLFDYREMKLDNGLRVVTLEDFSTPIVSVQVWYHVGSKNEDPGRQGFAHMFEHMMFKGTDLVSEKDHFDLIRQVGGSANGYTSFDRTVYLETVPSSQIELALWLEAERMTFLKIDRQRFSTERRVVEEERRMRLNEPYGTLMEKVLPEVFHVSPYRWTPIGQIPHLRAAKVAELREFWKKNYVPSNATLIIVGAIKHARAEELAEKYFGWIPKYPQVKQDVPKEPDKTTPEMITIKEDNAPAPLAGILFKTAPASSVDDVTLTILAKIMGQGQSSRLYRELVAKRQLAVNVMAESYSLEREGIFGIGAVMGPFGADPNKVMAVLNEQIEKVRTEPVSERELTKAKNQMLKGIVTETLTVGDKASMLGQAIYDMNDITRVNRQMAEIRAVTADSVLAAAKKYLDPQKRMEMRVNRNLVGTAKGVIGAGPDVDGAVAEDNDVNVPAGRGDVERPSWWPKTAPVSKELPVPATPKFAEKKLANGLRVVVVPNNEVPFISVQLGNTFGAWADNKPGSASMAMSMLTRGTKKHSEEQIADELETYAISLGGGSDIDTSFVRGNCVKDQLDRMMKMMAEVVLEPNFPKEEFGILKQQVMTGLSIKTEEPEYIAEKNFRQIFYGEHPYSRSETGELEDVNTMSVQDANNWYQTYSWANAYSLIFAGDITPEQAFGMAQKYFTPSKWQVAKAFEQKAFPKVPDVNSTKIYLVDNPGVQSRLIVGQKGILRKDERYFTSRVVNDYFGMGFSSRLNESVRVQKGLTYGIYGGYFTKRFAGEFDINTFTKTEATGRTLAAMIEEIGKLKTVAPSQKEVENSRSYIVGSFLERRETPQQIADDLWLIISNDLPADYFERMLAGVGKTTGEDCVKLVNETIDPNKMVIVIVGNSAMVKGELEKIGQVEEVKN